MERIITEDDCLGVGPLVGEEVDRLRAYKTKKRTGIPTPNPTPRPILAPSDSPPPLADEEEVEEVVVFEVEAVLEVVVVTVFTVAGRAEEAARSSSVEENPRDSARPAACTARVKEPSESFFFTPPPRFLARTRCPPCR